MGETDLEKGHRDLIMLSDLYLTVKGEKYYCKYVTIKAGETIVIVCTENEKYLFTSTNCHNIPERCFYSINTPIGVQNIRVYNKNITETKKILEAEIIRKYHNNI
jgi:hypothetical protein